SPFRQLPHVLQTLGLHRKLPRKLIPTHRSCQAVRPQDFHLWRLWHCLLFIMVGEGLEVFFAFSNAMGLKMRVWHWLSSDRADPGIGRWEERGRTCINRGVATAG